MSIQDVISFLKESIFCSIFVRPLKPGLTAEELRECAQQAGFQNGEFEDAFRQLVLDYGWEDYLKPKEAYLILWTDFHHSQNPDYRNVKAFQHVHDEMANSAKAIGALEVRIPRSVLVARGVNRGIPEKDIEVAVTMLVMVGRYILENDIIRYTPGKQQWPGPSTQISQSSPAFTRERKNETRENAYRIVQDVASRIDDGRRLHAEPLDAFCDELTGLGFGHFQLWWKQLVAEFRISDEGSTPVSLTVISAALMEGALTFAMQHVQEHEPQNSMVRTLDSETRKWGLPDLIKRASGSEKPILSAAVRHRADQLVIARQRIHAGRMLSDHPGTLPDLRPSEARDSRATAEAVVQSLLDWLALRTDRRR